jgi:hypothetical protein
MAKKEIMNWELDNVNLKNFFKIARKEIIRALDENPNNYVQADIQLKFGGDTNASMTIKVDETIVVLPVNTKED